MSLKSFRLLALAAFLPCIAHAQGGTVVDLSKPVKAMTPEDYSALVACTVREHPIETRQTAEFMLLRRDNQTPEQNEKDPGSKLLFTALKGCFEPKVGQAIPFSLNRLVLDWGKYHKVAEPMIVRTNADVAECAMRYSRGAVEEYLSRPAAGFDALAGLHRLLGPMCRPDGKLSLNIDELRSELIRRSPASARAGQEAH